MRAGYCYLLSHFSNKYMLSLLYHKLIHILFKLNPSQMINYKKKTNITFYICIASGLRSIYLMAPWSLTSTGNFTFNKFISAHIVVG
jgi:hypothetical protein